MSKTNLHSILGFLTILFSGLTVAAQNPSPTPPVKIDDGEIIKVESRLIVVPVAVVDANGNPVQGLTMGDFRVLEEGKQQTLESVGSADKVPLEIALLFDVSASTDAMFKFEQETAAKFLREVLRPEDRATIYTIGQKPILIQGRDVADRSIASVMTLSATKGATAFFDTVSAAAKQLRTVSPDGTRRVIVVISDGEDNFSEGLRMSQRMEETKIANGKPDPEYAKIGKLVATAQEQTKLTERRKVIRQLNDADAVFFSINPGGSSYLLNKISIFGQENMKAFADMTGGSAYLPKFQPVDTKDPLSNSTNMRRNQAILEQIFRQLASELRAQYLVQYYSESDFPQNKFVKLDVGVNRGGVKVRAREGYYVKK